MPNSKNSPHRYIFTCLELLCDMLYQSRMGEWDVMIHDGKADGIEMNAAVYDGRIDLTDPAARTVVEQLTERSPFWSRGFNGLDCQQAKMLFANGIGSMYMDGSWEAEAITQSVDFEVGVFPMPTVTTSTIPFVDRPRNDSNYNLSFAVGAVAKKRGRFEEVMDFSAISPQLKPQIR